MQTHKLNILSSFQVHKKKCKFNRSCNLFSNVSYTCTHVGGRYCGKFRIMNRKAEKMGAIDINHKFMDDQILVA